MSKIKIYEYPDNSCLYHHYDGQAEPQPCFLELDSEAEPPTVRADWNGEIGGGVPSRVWSGELRRYAIPALKAKAVNDLMTELLPLLDRVVAGYDGGDFVGDTPTLTDDADDAELEIQKRCEFCDPDMLYRAWDAGDWLVNQSDSELGVTALSTDGELAAIADAMEKEIELGTHLPEVDRVDGVLEELTRRRDYLLNNV